MNLSTAQSANRSREVGLRKVVGSTRKSLVIQFLAESIVLTLLALILAVIIVEYCLPYFNKYIDLQLSVYYFNNWYIIPGLFLIAVLIGILAGIYPSLFLATFRPVQILSGKLKQGAKSGILRSILVSIQFFISILIILCTTIIYRQINYMLNKDLGFKKEQLLVLRRAEAIGKDQIQVFKQEIKKYPGVINETIKNIEDTWEKFISNDPMQYFFLDEEFNKIYQEEKRTSRLSLGFAILAIFIACLGLYGLTSFAAVKRTREIGVRKVMGASITRIIVLFILLQLRILSKLYSTSSVRFTNCLPGLWFVVIWVMNSAFLPYFV